MPYYTYKARNEHGEAVKGKVEARSVEQAAVALRGRNLVIVSITPEIGGAFGSLSLALDKVSNNDVVNFTRQLSTMITAGLSLTDALSILERKAKPSMSKLLDELLRDIEGGKTLADALEEQDKHFSRVFTQLVKAGETAGVLDEMLVRLADNMEKNKEFKAKTQGALVYPAIVVAALIIVAVVMMIFVIPKMTEMYKDFGAELPVPTQIIISISDFTTQFWWLFLVFFIAIGIGIRMWWQTPAGERKISEYLLRIPLYGDLRKKVILTEFSRTLSLLLTAGISLLQALDISKEAMPNVLFRDSIGESASKVEKGFALGAILGNDPLFPPLLSQMVTVGEETGQLDEVLMKVSQYFQAESENAVKNLTTAIEPMIMIVLGLGVGLLVVAIVMPIYSLTNQF